MNTLVGVGTAGLRHAAVPTPTKVLFEKVVVGRQAFGMLPPANYLFKHYYFNVYVGRGAEPCSPNTNMK